MTQQHFISLARSGKVRNLTPQVPKTTVNNKKVGRIKIKSKLQNKTNQFKSGNQRLNENSENNQHFKDGQLNTVIGIERYLFREEKRTLLENKFRNYNKLNSGNKYDNYEVNTPLK
ncbi:hypothetical protein ABK040_006198 [Willaertia magna]